MLYDLSPKNGAPTTGLYIQEKNYRRGPQTRMDTGFAGGKVWEFLAKSVNMSKIAWKGILHV